MLSSVLNSERAIEVNILIMQAPEPRHRRIGFLTDRKKGAK